MTVAVPPATVAGRARRLVQRLGRRVRRALLAESARSAVAAAVVVPAVLAHRLVTDPAEGARLTDDVLLAMAAYQTSYLVVTLAVFHRAPRDVLDLAAERMPVGGFLNRWVYFNEPGTGAALSVAVLAMGVAVVVLPRAGSLPSSLPPAALTALGVAVVVASWSTMLVTYALDYLRRDVAGGRLRFPDEDERTFPDYLHVAATVATTFGTGSVTVTGTALRRVVTGQALVAFGFNAVIISLAVASLAALRG